MTEGEKPHKSEKRYFAGKAHGKGGKGKGKWTRRAHLANYDEYVDEETEEVLEEYEPEEYDEEYEYEDDSIAYVAQYEWQELEELVEARD